MIPLLVPVGLGLLGGYLCKEDKDTPIYTPTFAGGGGVDNVLSEVVDDEIRVYEDVLRDICRGVGEGVQDLDAISKSLSGIWYPNTDEIQNEIHISFIENAWGGISIEEWNKLENKLNKYVGSGEFDGFSINPTKQSVTLEFTRELPMGLYYTKTFADGGGIDDYENEIYKELLKIYSDESNKDKYGQVGISNYTESKLKKNLSENAFKYLIEGKSKYGKLSTYGGRYGTYKALNPTSEFYQKAKTYKYGEGGGLDDIEIEITKEEPDERGIKKSIKYHVNYQITINGKFMEIEGYLKPYHSGRSKEYEFEPSYFRDNETENYFDDNWEEIEKQILNKFYNN